MAETIVAASTRITFSTIANTAIALKRLRDGMKHAPENLSWLSEQLDCLQLVISNLETSITHSFNGCTNAEHLLPFMKGCQTALDTLQKLINDLSTDIFSGAWTQRTKAKFKAVMKEEQVSRYEQRLERTMRLLCLAQQNYAIELAQLLPGRLLATLEHQALQKSPRQVIGQSINSITERPPPVSDTRREADSPNLIKWQQPNKNGYIYYTTKTKSQEHLQRTAQLQIQFPRWLLNRMWDIYIKRSTCGWKVNLLQSNFHDDTLYDNEALWQGTRNEIFAALAEQGFQLCDRFENGYTLPQSALLWGRYDIALELLERGAPLDPRRDISIAYHFTHRKNEGLKANIQAFIRQLMWRRMLDEVLMDPLQLSICEFSLSTLNHLILDNIDMFNVLIKCLNISRPPLLWNNIPWYAMSPKTVMDLYDDLNDDAKSCFHDSISEATDRSINQFAVFFFNSQNWRCISRSEYALQVDSASKMGVIFGSHIPFHMLSPYGAGTPLYNMLQATMQRQLPFSYMKRYSQAYRKCNTNLQRWLQALYSAGVDLRRYGDQEVSAFQRISKTETRLCAFIDRNRIPYYPPRLERMDAGPKPEDWKLSWDYCYLDYLREFWESVEFKPCMPGAWVED